MRHVWMVMATSLACGGAVPQPLVATDDAFPAPPAEPEPVEVDFVADSATIAAGDELRVAVRFAIRPGWKIYWSNPGEAGLPTEVDIRAPSGFAVGDVAYPAPHAFENGGVLSYGYSKEVLLSAVVRAPTTASLREAIVTAEARWLACRDTCRRGRGHIELRLPVVPRGAEVGANGQLFARHMTRVPAPLDRAVCEVHAGDASAVVACRGATALEFLPAADSQHGLLGQLSAATEQGAELRVRFEEPAPARLRGVLRVAFADGLRYYACDEALSGPAAPTGVAAK